MTVTSPGWLSPPVRSETSSHRDHPVPFHDSHTVGGSSGSTPTPRTSQSRRIAIASPGAGSSSPSRNSSPTFGRLANASSLSLRRRASRTNGGSSPDRFPMRRRDRGGISSSTAVWKTIDSTSSFRGVATAVCSGTTTTSSRGAASHITTSAVAGVGGYSVVPIRSRKAMYSLSGTRFSRYSELVGHEGECLDERHARVGHVVIRPFGAPGGDEPLRVVDEVLEPAIVEVRHRQGHGSPSERSGMT